MLKRLVNRNLVKSINATSSSSSASSFRTTPSLLQSVNLSSKPSAKKNVVESSSNGDKLEIPSIFSGPQRNMLKQKNEQEAFCAQQRTMADRVSIKFLLFFFSLFRSEFRMNLLSWANRMHSTYTYI